MLRMYEEHDVIALTDHVSAERVWAEGGGRFPLARNGYGRGLPPGYTGTIINIYPEHAGYTLEFVDAEGWTIGIADVSPSEIRPATEADLRARRQAIPEPA